MERIKEIIAYLIESRSRGSQDPDVLYEELEKLGYSYEEVTEALRMLEFEPDREAHRSGLDFKSRVRILSESEKLILSTPAQGYLLRLKRLGLLTETKLNLIIENASLEVPPPVSLAEIKEIASRYVIDLPEDIPPDVSPQDEQVH